MSLKPAGRQWPLKAKVDFTFEDFGEGAVTATTVFELLDLPQNAIVTGGLLVVATAFNSSGAATVAIGDGVTANRYLGDTDLKTPGATALVPTGYVYPNGDTLDADVAIAGSAATAGAGYLIVEYILDGRAHVSEG